MVARRHIGKFCGGEAATRTTPTHYLELDPWIARIQRPPNRNYGSAQIIRHGVIGMLTETAWTTAHNGGYAYVLAYLCHH